MKKVDCKHVFVGKSDGVHCEKCGFHMSAEEYAKSLNSKPKTNKQPRKKVTKDE